MDLYVDTINSIAQKFPDWSFNLIGSSKLGEIDINEPYAQKLKKSLKI